MLSGGFSASTVSVAPEWSGLVSVSMCLTQIYEKCMELNMVLAAVRAKPPGQHSPCFPSGTVCLSSELPQTIFPLRKNKQKLHMCLHLVPVK